MNPHNHLCCHRCGKPADVSNPSVSGVLPIARVICVRCTVELSVPLR